MRPIRYIFISLGPSVVIVDKGMARSFTTDTLHSGIYAFTFDQQGLIAGLGLQDSKVMRDRLITNQNFSRIRSSATIELAP